MAKNPVKYFVVDAFTEKAFKGSPAGVCLLEDVKDEEWPQAVASELNMPKTAFLTRIADSDHELQSPSPRFALRWFIPVAEVELCGHPTLAASHVLFTYGLEISKGLNDASGIEIKKTTTAEDLVVVLPSGKAVAELEPQFDEVKRYPGRGIIVTGPALPESEFDFYSRFFCLKFGFNEESVCGSAHCALAPYWSKKLGKCDFLAYQASLRSGVINLHPDEKDQRVLLRGEAVVVAEGSILV